MGKGLRSTILRFPPRLRGREVVFLFAATPPALQLGIGRVEADATVIRQERQGVGGGWRGGGVGQTRQAATCQ